jgi:hypothetical protein
VAGWPPPGPNEFEWQDGRLTFRHDGAWLSVAPTADEWKEFWKVRDDVGVWSWPAEVGDLANVRDGLLYALEIEVGSRSVKSKGQVVGSPPGFDEKLRQFHRALQTLVGRFG